MGVERSGDILPKRDAIAVRQIVLADIFSPLAGIGPVQIENEIDVVRCAEVDQLPDERAVAGGVAFLSGGLAEPAILC